MKFDINKVICISLKSHNDQQLKAISEVYKLDFDGLVKIKESSSKIWVEVGGEYVIAFSVNSGDGTPEVSDKFCPITKRDNDSLLKIQPMNFFLLLNSFFQIYVFLVLDHCQFFGFD